jgi:hypothetical protein
MAQTDGRNCLRVATDKGFLPVVQEVVAAGAIVDWTDKVRGRRATLPVASRSWDHLARAPLSQMNFQTALHRACIHGFFEIAVFLLNSGANIDRRDKVGVHRLAAPVDTL